MNPTNEPYDSANKPPVAPVPPTSTSSSDAAALQAIEALETESNQIPELEVTSPAPVATPVTSTPAPVTPAPVVTEPTPVETPVAPVAPVPATPAAAIAKTLSEDSSAPGTSSEFQPFAKKKSSKKSLIVLIIIFAVILLGAGGYFGWQYWQTQQVKPVVTQPDTSTEDETPATTDTADSVNTAITDMQKQLTAADDTEYNDSTLTDSSLYN